ncbi:MULTISPECIES: argininosuccinate synthase [Dehalococcoides]|jgi:argininosuccinate synthase|uniref:Argininosuccinate synthase n=3 Tax=Dehalococcoides mccartyi TaxID=61435 RepID=ASSY_DEHMC|nr:MULTISPECIES: argininosuccinate synthase [Dehalococcoides]A5FQ73.1 RecName: Full=Argininosuccinate synthase; AltName: Full=Citrulline--aspartate ligase [Dehalococcoides mccartyi BAV1]Q3ZYG0.1 RecName: Full=Argininosuccinate synthase; AltName: Full=Citrulline--aspartate ligase [Dehalococcoides mccartyi CBDB1]AGG06719.1 argininosuccinate synthase [Dehalococcoides mccartyi DCMB5]AII61218.1 argininosuccinate synthase [Dehalococcoides mccartyi CG5]AMU86913.1 argininosuccinate synthase [Dehalococ
MSEKVVLAYSGGLDTSAAVKWLQEKYGMDVIAVTIDVGNEKDFTLIKEKALKVGAKKAYVRDVRKEFAEDYIWKAIKANSMYEGVYPLATALARPLIAKVMVDIALEEGATAIAHGCTGKGNDQVRFDVGINTLAPHLKIIAPARQWGMTREQTMEYAQKWGIPVPISVKNPFSIDENLWGRSIECGLLEDPWNEPIPEVFAWTRPVEETPDEPEYLEVEFEQGVPVAVNGEKLSPLALIQKVHDIASLHGVGRIDHVENRLVGIKSREIYEAPAAVVLIAAHQALEAMTLSKSQLRFKQMVEATYSDIIYNGLWFSALRQDLDAFIDSSQRFVSGTVRLKLSKGSFRVVGRKSPYSLYHKGMATYDKGDQFDPSSAVGFITLWGLQAKLQAQLQPILEEEKGNKS